MGFEPIRTLLSKGFSYHYSFHYQNQNFLTLLKITVVGYYFCNCCFLYFNPMQSLFVGFNFLFWWLCSWSGLSLNHIEISRPKSYTIFTLKASTSLITSHNNNTCVQILKCVTHAISFKGNLYIPTLVIFKILYKLFFQLRFLL